MKYVLSIVMIVLGAGGLFFFGGLAFEHIIDQRVAAYIEAHPCR